MLEIDPNTNFVYSLKGQLSFNQLPFFNKRFSIPLQIRFTIAATILTAVDTAPGMIRTEMRGVINPLPDVM